MIQYCEVVCRVKKETYSAVNYFAWCHMMREYNHGRSARASRDKGAALTNCTNITNDAMLLAILGLVFPDI